jgi:hypothetical protein
VIEIPSTKAVASHKPNRFKKKPTSPSEIKLIGRVKSFKSGIIVQFKKVKTIKNRIAVEIFSTLKLSKIVDKKNKIIVFIVKNKAASIIKIYTFEVCSKITKLKLLVLIKYSKIDEFFYLKEILKIA